MRALGFGPAALRWVGLLLEGSEAQVVLNGHRSRRFPVLAGVAQGSPLSPLLYVMQAQPLAARLRQLQRQGRLDAMLLPGGGPAPPSHQHADDTVIHTATVAGAQVALAEAVRPYCEASNSTLSAPKCRGMVLGAHPPLVGVHAATGVEFVGGSEGLRHLGVQLGTGDRATAAAAMYAKALQAVAARVALWRRRPLTLIGRVHVAKQVLANVICYLATFVEAPGGELAALQRVIDGYIVHGADGSGAGSAPLQHQPAGGDGVLSASARGRRWGP